MTRITLHGEPLYTDGMLPAVGQVAPRLLLATASLGDVGLDHFGRTCKVIDIMPSLDTPPGALSARRCNELAGRQPDTTVLLVTADLPFASQRLCEALRLDRLVTLSTFRSPHFARSYGVAIVGGVLRGLTARAIVVLDAQHKVLHAELVREITAEPDYSRVAAVLEGERRPRHVPAIQP